LPKNAPQPQSDAFTKVETQANDYYERKIAANAIQTKNWTTQEWLHFLTKLAAGFGARKNGGTRPRLI
jgi:leukotriene-A4 hydrolase